MFLIVSSGFTYCFWYHS